MSRYLLIRRLRGPAFILLVGINALLAQAHILGWSQSWPLYLILAGLLLLAERAALTFEGDAAWGAIPPAPGVPPMPPNPPVPSSETAIVPVRTQGFDDVQGGQS